MDLKEWSVYPSATCLVQEKAMGDTEGAGYELDYIPMMDLVWGKGFIAPGGEGNVDHRVKALI